jgi:hypothetical protein
MPNPNNQTKENLIKPAPNPRTAQAEVKENEEASLQDDSYSFDSENTGNDDIHDVSDFEGESLQEDF